MELTKLIEALDQIEEALDTLLEVPEPLPNSRSSTPTASSNP